MDLLKIIGIICVVIGVPSGVIFGLAILGASITCHIQADKMGFESSWGIMQDCMIRVDGKWIPFDAFKVVGVRK